MYMYTEFSNKTFNLYSLFVVVFTYIHINLSVILTFGKLEPVNFSGGFASEMN